jgi:hypothetical protein
MGGEPKAGGVLFELGAGGREASVFVMARFAGTLFDLLCFRRFVEGPGMSVGDACLDKFLDPVPFAVADVPFFAWPNAFAVIG